MRYFINLAYDGTRYHGWQIQPNGITIEGELERCLSVLLRQPVDIVGAGRTDAGVHARQMVAHFDIEKPIVAEDVAYRLNRMLPPDIAVYEVKQVSDDMHARFSAISRTYHYYVSTKATPFNRQYTWIPHFSLDFELMNEAAKLLLKHKDFACFCKSHTDVKTTLCDVTEAQWVKTGENDWYFRIAANRFLRNMVRAVVGTLVEVGRHRMTLQQFQDVLDAKSRTQAGESMPGHALFLENVRY